MKECGNYSYHKKFSLLCEECNCLTEQSVSLFFDGTELAPDFYDDFSNEYYCKNCNKFTYQFDIERNIAKSVRLLRIHDYNTRFSCEGHSKLIFINNEYFHDTSYPYISFDYKEDLISKYDKFEKVLNANGWKLDLFSDNEFGKWRIGTDNIEFDDEKFKENPEEYVEYLNKQFKEADEKLFKALLEIFIEE